MRGHYNTVTRCDEDVTKQLIVSHFTDLIIDTTTTSELPAAGEEEEVIIKLIEDNENQEKQLADSLEEVINNLSEIVGEEVTTIESFAGDDSSENASTVGGGETTSAAAEIETTTESVQNDDLSVPNEPGDSTQQPIVQTFITQQALDRLNGANLTEKDMKILTALLELETLKGEQKDTRQEIENKLTELELLLDADSSLDIDDIEQLVRSQEAATQKPRQGKTVKEFEAAVQGIESAVNIKTQAVNLFENIQKQLFSLLDERHKFLKIVSDKINSELNVIQQTVNFLQQLVNLKLDQGNNIAFIIAL